MALLGVMAAVVMLARRDPAPPIWAQRAEEWSAARNEAADAGVANLLEFVEPDVLLDLCGASGTAKTVGRKAYAAFLQAEFGEWLSLMRLDDIYLDREGAVLTVTYSPDVVVEMGASGRTTVERYPNPALDVWPAASAEDERTLGVARAYLEAWGSGDHAALDALYADDAVLTDSLTSTSLHGVDAVVRSSDDLRSGGRSYTVRQGSPIPGIEAGPTWPVAASVCWQDGPGLAGEVIYVPVTMDDGHGCPGEMSVALQVTDGVVEAERRYRLLQSVRECLETDDLPAGWWTDLEVPLPYAERTTGQVETRGARVQIHNGTDALATLVTWAFDRYETAGLAPPAVDAVTFDEGVRARECVGDRSGLTVDDGDTARVFVCLDEAAACAKSTCDAFTNHARRVILHEFAHAWMGQNLDDGARRAFLDHMALPTWRDATVDWNQSGLERAAQVIAWGLMDEPFGTGLIVESSCAHLRDAFTVLTGVAPLQQSCT